MNDYFFNCSKPIRTKNIKYEDYCSYHIFARHLLDTIEFQIPNKHLNYLVFNLITVDRFVGCCMYNTASYVLTHLRHLNLSLPEQDDA